MSLGESAFLQPNLDALAIRQPDAAGDVAGAFADNFATPAIGRDGSATYRLRRADGSGHWFGGSSMPTISAAATAERVVVDGRNLSLAGIGTGLEAVQIVRRLPPFAGLFVIEPDPRLVHLALRLYDYRPFLNSGRMAFILGDNVPAAFDAFFDCHPTYEFPTSLLPTPQPESDAPARFAALQREVERAAAVVTRRQAALVEAAARRLAGRATVAASDRPRRFAVLSTDPRAAALDHAHRITRAFEAAELPHAVCVPDRPERCHILARLDAVERVQADAVILINTAAGPLASLLPSRVRIASWYLPEAVIPGGVANELGPSQRVFAAGAATRAALTAAGVEASRIESLDVGADVIIGDCPTTDRLVACGIAIMADLPSADAAAWGITLPSHAMLWKAMLRVVAEDADGYAPEAAEGLLRRAEAACGVSIADAAMRSRFVTLLREVIAPIQCARAAASALGGSGPGLTIWGAGWEAMASSQDVRRGPVPRDGGYPRILKGSRVVVLPSGHEAGLRLALDALAAGCAVCVRMSAVEIAMSAPSLAPLVPHLHPYRTRAELVSLVHRLSADSGEVDHAVAKLVRDEHSVAARLDSLVARLVEPLARQETARVVHS